MKYSVLRYPGGKSRAIKILDKYIPEGVTELCSPFVGGGSFEQYLAVGRGIRVYGYDVYEPLVSFYESLLKDRELLVELVEGYLGGMDREMFNHLKHILPSVGDKVSQGAMFFVLNRCSFSGSTCSGGMSKGVPRFNRGCVDRLEQINLGFTISEADFAESIPKHDCLIYADPPYAIENYLYGNKGDTHKDFPHEDLAKLLLSRGNFVLSYNDCEYIRDLYSGCKIYEESWTYGMTNGSTGKELVIVG